MDAKTKQILQADWRGLGFFYDRDDSSKEWRIVGSRMGLLEFARLLEAYTSNKGNEGKSQHAHYGPYQYLELMTWPQTGIDGHAIFGLLPAFAALAQTVENKIRTIKPGQRARINREFSEGAEYTIILDMRDDEFDPASADPALVT